MAFCPLALGGGVFGGFITRRGTQDQEQAHAQEYQDRDGVGGWPDPFELVHQCPETPERKCGVDGLGQRRAQGDQGSLADAPLETVSQNQHGDGAGQGNGSPDSHQKSDQGCAQHSFAEFLLLPLPPLFGVPIE